MKGLHKVVKKAKHSSKRCVGSLEQAWEKLVALLEAEEEAHRTLANGLSADCAKALKGFTDQQIKQREPVRGGRERGGGSGEEGGDGGGGGEEGGGRGREGKGVGGRGREGKGVGGRGREGKGVGGRGEEGGGRGEEGGGRERGWR